MDQSTSITKTCTVCKVALPLEVFSPNKGGLYGRRATCNACRAPKMAAYEASIPPEERKRRFHAWYDPRKAELLAAAAAWQKANPERMRAAYRRYRDAHREKTIAATIAWNKANRERNAAAARARRAADPERYRAVAKARTEANPDKLRAQRAAYRLAHKEQEAANCAAWERAHPDVRQEYKERRRARRMAAPLIERIDRAAIIARDNSTCYLCGRVLIKGQITLDHVIPLIGGGPHTAANLRVACRPCNSRKREHSLEEYLAQYKGV